LLLGPRCYASTYNVGVVVVLICDGGDLMLTTVS
jgi:hypothetical protein